MLYWLDNTVTSGCYPKCIILLLGNFYWKVEQFKISDEDKNPKQFVRLQNIFATSQAKIVALNVCISLEQRFRFKYT